VFAETEMLAAPQLTESWWNDSAILAQSFGRARRGGRNVLPPREAPWPGQPEITLASADPTLPVPAPGVFEVAEGLRRAMQDFSSAARRAEQAAAIKAEAERPAKPTRAEARQTRRAGVASASRGKRTVAGRPVQQARSAARAGRTAAKPVISDKKNARRPGRHQEAQLQPAPG
jgi:hypothetical protein